MKKSIGILGGMGPQASMKFYSLLIEKSQKNYQAVKNEDYPFVYISNIPVKDLIKEEKEEKQTKDFVKSVAQDFEKIGCAYIAMTCNTMHLYEKYITKNIDTPFISMIDAVVSEVKNKKCKKVGLLGSKTTLLSTLYSHPLKMAGIGVEIPKKTDIDILANIIHKIIAASLSKKDHFLLKKIINDLKMRNIDGIILGCTELPLIIDKNYAGIDTFSSLDILAESVLKKYYGNIQ